MSARPSFLPIAPDSHFPLENLPFGIFSPPGGAPRVGTRVGETAVDLAELARHGFFDGTVLQGEPVFAEGALNRFMALGRAAWRAARQRLQALLAADNGTLRDDPLLEQVTWPVAQVQMHLPAEIGDYTDFYSSAYHAGNVGRMFRPDREPLLSNWKHLPVAYHGRASSVVLDGTPIRRPRGQILPPGAERPVFGSSRELDFELEMGFFVGPGNVLGQAVPIGDAEAHIFGLVLVNDWSARDIQRWEYRPLGPFLAKNFATSISPWVVTLEALEPFRTPGPQQDPQPLPYLQQHQPRSYDIQLQVTLQSAQMAEPLVISRSNVRHLYWSMAQQLAHHTITGCNLRPGDLLASGTISGPTADSLGSLLEISWRGQRPLQLPGGETRTFLEDGDTLTLSAWCAGEGWRVGFGEVRGRVLAEDAPMRGADERK